MRISSATSYNQRRAIADVNDARGLGDELAQADELKGIATAEEGRPVGGFARPILSNPQHPRV